MTKEEILKASLERYLLKLSDIDHGTDAIPHLIYMAMDQYAISVLEELRVKLAEGDMRYPVNAADRKILELKALL